MTGGKPSWNPLRCGGTDLRPEVLLSAKILAIVCLRFQSLWWRFPTPFVPYLSIFNFVAGVRYVFAMKGILLAASLCVIFNRHVRLASSVMGSCLLIAVFSSRTYFQNNILFTGCVLFCIGLTSAGKRPKWLQLQIALVYFGAGLNKLADPDWQAGQFLAHWAPRYVIQPAYFFAANNLPSGLAPRLMSWGTIATELSLAFFFLFRRFNWIGIWIGLFLHTGLLWLTDRTFGVFFFSATASYIALADWPRDVVVTYRHGYEWLKRLDLDGRFRWNVCTHSASGLSMSTQHVVYSGFGAVRQILLYSPLTFFVLFAIVQTPEPSGLHFRDWVAPAILVPFLLTAARPLPSAN